jgi:pimeloyl-ACP methyl ester carboxylesterase
MTPVYIAGCFGVLHPAGGTRGVLILGSLGDEAMNTYRPLLFLAERFAEAGCPALRLDYYGWGDSAGSDEEGDRFATWLGTVSTAARWMRESCGVRRLTLVGTRIGAAIAARAACDIPDVEALILLSPVPSGRRFLRARALLLEEPDSPAGGTVAERLQRLGVETTRDTVPGFAAMLRDPYENTVPHDGFARAVQWHAALAPADAVPDRIGTYRPRCAVLNLGDAWERPVRYGPDSALFGIVCEPASPVPGAPVVLIANTGANPRYSNARAATTIARWLARLGIASLRMDGTGIGDSLPVTGERGRPYSAEGDSDMQAALDALSARFSGPVIVLGMCSGAYHALQAAFHDTRVRGLILVNLQKFVWQDGESLSMVQRSTFRTTRFYLRNAFTFATMQRLLHGDINARGIAQALAGRVARRVAAVCDPALRFARGQETAVGRVRRQMHDLAERSVPILFVLSGNDPGLDEVAQYFGAQGRQFRRLPNVTFHMLDGADHTLSAHWARQALQQRIAAYLNQIFDVPVKGLPPRQSAPPLRRRRRTAEAAPSVAIAAFTAATGT